MVTDADRAELVEKLFNSDMPDDDAHKYFEHQFGEWDWCDIYREGNEILAKILGGPIDDGSPISCLMAAVAAHAADSAFNSVSAMLGDKYDIKAVASYWYENQNDPPEPITLDELAELDAEYKADLAEFEAGLKQP